MKLIRQRTAARQSPARSLRDLDRVSRNRESAVSASFLVLPIANTPTPFHHGDLRRVSMLDPQMRRNALGISLLRVPVPASRCLAVYDLIGIEGLADIRNIEQVQHRFAAVEHHAGFARLLPVQHPQCRAQPSALPPAGPPAVVKVRKRSGFLRNGIASQAPSAHQFHPPFPPPRSRRGFA